jgi:succinate-semialdehyde dehydrogenase/glutarate-semialdehyde dehydrogenase
LAEGLEHGLGGANDGPPSTPEAAVGDMKESGLGREGGDCGLDLFLETKWVSGVRLG